MPLPIERYAVIGDRHTAALVGDDGSIDWLCLPRFDSPASFAALLGSEEHGRWLIGPVEKAAVTRRYVGDSPLLETTFTTATGCVRLLDAMPADDGRHDLVRRLVGVEGTVRIRHDWVVRTGYGRVRPWVSREQHGDTEVIVAVSGADQLTLRGPRLPIGDGGHHRDEFDVRAGEELTFTTTWTPSWWDTPGPHLRERAEQQVPGVAGVGRPVPGRRPAPRGRGPQPGDAAADEPCRHRRHRGRPDHLAARGDRRRAQLGLSLLLAARRRADPRVAAHRRLHRRGPQLAALAAAGCGRRPRGPTDHVHRRRRPRAARARARPPARLRGIDAGADRQRRRRTAPARRARRGDDRARPGARLRPPRVPLQLGSAVRPARPAGDRHRQPRPRTVGDPRPPAVLHPLPGDGLGRPRPRAARYRAARPRRAGRQLARLPRRRARGDRGPRLRRRARHLRAAPRHPRGRRRPAGAARGGLPRGRRPPHARDHPGRRGGSAPRRAGAPLPHGSRGSTGSAAARARSWPARSGWSRRTPPLGAATTPGR